MGDNGRPRPHASLVTRRAAAVSTGPATTAPPTAHSALPHTACVPNTGCRTGTYTHRMAQSTLALTAAISARLPPKCRPLPRHSKMCSICESTMVRKQAERASVRLSPMYSAAV